MNLCDQVRPLLRRLAGGDPMRTISQGRLNWIVKVDSDQVWVHTEKSRQGGEPEPVPIEWVEDVCRLLVERGEVSRGSLRGHEARFRSALIFSILSQLPEVRYVTRPRATLCLS
jgi:hypothetical protein